VEVIIEIEIIVFFVLVSPLFLTRGTTLLIQNKSLMYRKEKEMIIQVPGNPFN
jgi:hypothetical protein